MTKHELSKLTGVSISFLSDLTNGKANPSLKVMALIAEALEVPLPLLLESTDIDGRLLTADDKNSLVRPSLPPGYVRAAAILTSHQAFQVKKWHEINRAKLRDKPVKLEPEPS